MQRLVSMRVVIDHGGVGARSNFLRSVKAGLFPPGIKIGRSRMWPEYEVEALQRARIAGKSDDEVRTLVCELIEQRKALTPPLASRNLGTAAS